MGTKTSKITCDQGHELRHYDIQPPHGAGHLLLQYKLMNTGQKHFKCDACQHSWAPWSKEEERKGFWHCDECLDSFDICHQCGSDPYARLKPDNPLIKHHKKCKCSDCRDVKTRDILEKKIDSVRDGVEAKTINNEDNKNGDDNPIAEPHFRLRCTGCLMSSVQLTPTSSCLCVNCSDPIECLRQRIGAFDLLHQAYLRKIELNQHLQRIATQCAVNDVSSRSGKMKQNNTKSPEITRAPGSKISVTESPAPGDRTLSSPSPVPVKNIHVESLCLDCNDYACVGASLHVRMLPYAERTRMKEIKMKEGKHAPKVVGYKIFPERYEDGAR